MITPTGLAFPAFASTIRAATIHAHAVATLALHRISKVLTPLRHGSVTSVTPDRPKAGGP